MIHLEIITSNDPLAQGLYEFEFDHVHIGRSKKNDLIFVDKKLPLNYMILQIVEDNTGINLVARSQTRFPFFFVNGKKISGTLKIRPNDIISFEGNQIKIVSFKKTRADSDLHQAFSSFEKDAKDLRFSLDFIEEVLIDLDKKNEHV